MNVLWSNVADDPRGKKVRDSKCWIKDCIRHITVPVEAGNVAVTVDICGAVEHGLHDGDGSPAGQEHEDETKQDHIDGLADGKRIFLLTAIRGHSQLCREKAEQQLCGVASAADIWQTVVCSNKFWNHRINSTWSAIFLWPMHYTSDSSTTKFY